MKTWTELKNRTDWPGMKHDRLMCDRAYSEICRSTRIAKYEGGWQKQIAKIIAEKGF